MRMNKQSFENGRIPFMISKMVAIYSSGFQSAIATGLSYINSSINNLGSVLTTKQISPIVRGGLNE
jgi:hypothetical protein